MEPVECAPQELHPQYAPAAASSEMLGFTLPIGATATCWYGGTGADRIKYAPALASCTDQCCGGIASIGVVGHTSWLHLVRIATLSAVLHGLLYFWVELPMRDEL